ncbi:MAG: rod shape-determining protein MreD [Thiohalomonadaceae bacterium]
MTLFRHQHGWVIAASFAVALLLTMLPLPDWAAPLRPEWVVLVLIYWCMALPSRVGVGTGWILGLLLDVARGAILGQHALALSLVAFLAVHFHQRIRIYPLWQQGFSILMLVALAQMLVLWIKGVVGQLPGTWTYWLPSLTSSLFWPWVFLLLRDVRRRFRVA